MLFFHLDTTFSFRDKHRVKKKLIFSLLILPCYYSNYFPRASFHRSIPNSLTHSLVEARVAFLGKTLSIRFFPKNIGHRVSSPFVIFPSTISKPWILVSGQQSIAPFTFLASWKIKKFRPVPVSREPINARFHHAWIPRFETIRLLRTTR